jgi:hypothetical protein
MFRGAELMRLMTGILMLGIICMLMVRFRDPGMWRWVAPNGETKQTSTSEESKKPETPPLPEATGPTDEDPDQADEAKEEFQVLADGTLQLQREEMEAYDRLVEWVKNQSFERLYQRAKKDVWYTDLHDAPNRYRGKLVAFDAMEIRRAKFVEENRYRVPLHEAWGVTNESRGRPYDIIVVDYPKDMPQGYDIYAKADFAGYFLKLQGYEPGSAKPGQPPERAPLLIGRFRWKPAPVAAPPVDAEDEWTWGIGLLAVIALALAIRWGYYKWFRRAPLARPRIADAKSGEVIPVETWLEQADFGSEGDDGKESN